MRFKVLQKIFQSKEVLKLIETSSVRHQQFLYAVGQVYIFLNAIQS